jgi:subtilisin family serine protease
MGDFFIPEFKILEIGDAHALSETICWSLLDVQVPDTWKYSKGENVTIAIVDSGVDPSHEDLKENLHLDHSKSFHPNETTIVDLNGHGTGTAGICAAEQNDNGIIGVAPSAKIIAIKVLGESGTCSNDNIVAALKYLYSIKDKIDIINLSLGSTDPLPDEGYDIIKKLYNEGIVIVAAAGNDPKKGILYPAKYPEVFAIGSYGPNLIRDVSDFSAIGPELDFIAGGEKITTTWKNNKYSVLQGTSFASPFVSAIIALLIAKLKSENKKFTVDQIKQKLIDHCMNKGKNGFDNVRGYGIINPKELLANLDDGNNSNQNKIIKISWWQRILNIFK